MLALPPPRRSSASRARRPRDRVPAAAARDRAFVRADHIGLDPAQTGKITAALDEQGIAYELRSNGTALAVEKAQVAQARVTLAAPGVQATGGGVAAGSCSTSPSSAPPSCSSRSPTSARWRVKSRVPSRRRGRLEPARAARAPPGRPVPDEATPATAAMMLGNSSDTLQPGAVQGMAQLVSSSVKGLKSENVTITDATGQLLWPSADGGRRRRRHQQGLRRGEVQPLDGEPINAMLPRRSARTRPRSRSTPTSTWTRPRGRS